MKQTTFTLFVLMCLFSAHTLTAQSAAKKQLLFKQYPAVIHCTANQFGGLFTKNIGDKTDLNLNGTLLLKAVITNKISKFNNELQTIVLQLREFGNSTFSISKRKEQQTDVYIGHLYNANSADGYQLKQGKNNDYEMVKIAADQVLQPCNY